MLKNILPTDTKISDLEQPKAFIDSFCSSNEPEVIALALGVLGVPDEYKRFANKRLVRLSRVWRGRGTALG